MSLQIGDRIKGFRIEEILYGGMGKIYLCRVGSEVPRLRGALSSDTDAFVVWKSIDEERAWSDAGSRFRHEVALWFWLPHHPNVVPALGTAHDGNRFMIMLAHMPSGSLRERIAEPGMEVTGLMRALCEVGDAMEFLHSYGVIHRDLKPENVLFDSKNTARITDFGLSTVVEAGLPKLNAVTPIDRSSLPSTAQTRGIAGTLPYMAPELWSGSPATFQSDVFAFGVVMFEMLFGVRPFQGHTAEQLGKRILGHELVVPSRPVPHDLRALALQCLSGDPNERPGSFSVLTAQLRDIAVELAVEVPDRVDPHKVEEDAPAGSWMARGYGLGQLAFHEKSVICYQRAHELEPDKPEHMANLATGLLRMGRYEEGLRFGLRALESWPAERPIRWALHPTVAACLNGLGRYEEAEGLLRDAIDELADGPECAILYRELLFTLSNAEKHFAVEPAVADFVAWLDLTGHFFGVSDEPIILDEAIHMSEAGRYLAAKLLLQATKLRFPNLAAAWYNAGVVLTRQGEHEMAIDEFTIAIEKGLDHEFVLFNRGRGLMLVGRTEEGLEDFMCVLERFGVSGPCGNLAKISVMLPDDAASFLNDFDHTLVHVG